MIRLDEVRTRIEAKAPDFAGTFGNAAQFAAMVERDQLPQSDRAGYVLPGPLAGGTTTAATGMFIQDFTETVMVVLVIRHAGSALAKGALDELPPLVRDVIEGVVGWGPDDAPGVFKLGQAELVGSKNGALVYEIHFTLHDQMRVTP
ncbi:MAG: hypothetical protein KUG65_13165 [Sphingomonadaceae bacterium]|nr:hypothetical protein [Sphingomonadaceae bacterium]